MTTACKQCSADFVVPNTFTLPMSDEGNFWYFHLVDITPDIDGTKAIKAFQAAFDEIADFLYPLKFVSTSEKEKAQVVINFAVDGDEDLPEPFEDYVLAYAFFPYPEFELNGHIFVNDNLNWSNMTNDLKIILQHELIHCLNIGHSKDDNDIMFAEYSPQNTFANSVDTKEALIFLYGDFLEDKPEPPPKTKHWYLIIWDFIKKIIGI